MRVLQLVLATVAALGLVGCTPTPARTFGKPETDRINQLIGDFITAYNAKDAVRVSRLFTDGGAVMPPNASTVRGTENVREHYVKRFNQGASDLALEAHTIAGSGALAFASGDYRLVMAPPGGPERRDRGKFIFILRELNDKWLLDQLMFSSDFAPEVPAAR